MESTSLTIKKEYQLKTLIRMMTKMIPTLLMRTYSVKDDIVYHKDKRLINEHGTIRKDELHFSANTIRKKQTQEKGTHG